MQSASINKMLEKSGHPNQDILQRYNSIINQCQLGFQQTKPTEMTASKLLERFNKQILLVDFQAKHSIQFGTKHSYIKCI